MSTRAARLDRDVSEFQDLVEVIQHWDTARGEAWAPSWHSINLATFSPSILPKVCVIDVREDPLDFIYRFWGSGITRLNDYDLTGKSVCEAMAPGCAEAHLWQYEEVYHTREPGRFITEFTAPSGLEKYYICARLPLSDDGERVTGVLTAEIHGSKPDEYVELFADAWSTQHRKTASGG